MTTENKTTPVIKLTSPDGIMNVRYNVTAREVSLAVMRIMAWISTISGMWMSVITGEWTWWIVFGISLILSLLVG